MAGARTHIEMGALLWEKHLSLDPGVPPGLSSVLQSPANLAAYYSGCIFPDWGYDGIHDDAAEDSHWPPFQEAFTAFIKEQYAFPWDGETSRLVAFALGVVVHGITDDLWHFSRGEHHCFLEMAKARDNADHKPCEVAGDVYAHVQCTKRQMRKRFWWPADVIQAVYELREIPVTRAQLKAGFHKLERKWQKGATWSWLAYPYYRAKFPWCHTHYMGEEYGAVAHGAKVAARYVRDAFAQLEHQ